MSWGTFLRVLRGFEGGLFAKPNIEGLQQSSQKLAAPLLNQGSY